MQPLRIAYVTTFYPPFHFGGDGIVVRRFARALARRGHDVTVIHDLDAFRLLGGVPSEAGSEDDGVRVVPVGGRFPAVSGLLTHQIGRPTTTAATFDRLLNQGGFDVVHFHNISMIGGPGILSYGGDAVRLYTAHEHWLVCPMHVLWRHRREPCESKQCIRCAFAYRRPPQMYRYSGYMEAQLRHVDAFFAQTEFSRNKHADMGFGFPMEILSPFLPALEPSRAPGDDPSGGPYVLYAGRLERMKGLDDIVTQFRTSPPAELWIAGDGPHREVLEQIAGGAASVRFLGRVSNERVQQLMQKALAVVVPTVGYETFGFTALEAFRVGTPVLARRSGPLPELVESSGGGWLFDRGEEVVDLVNKLLGSAEFRDGLGAAGRRAFETRWSEDVVMPKYLGRIATLLTDRHNGRG